MSSALCISKVIAAQVWLRTISFIVWLAVACPCCRLQIADNVFDAFEQELAVPLLQCSFLAFACTLGGMVLVSGQHDPIFVDAMVGIGSFGATNQLDQLGRPF